jgi:hypothetical protein
MTERRRNQIGQNKTIGLTALRKCNLSKIGYEFVWTSEKSYGTERLIAFPDFGTREA